MVSTAAYRIRRAAGAFDPPSTGERDVKEQGTFGPTHAEAFFPAAAQRAPAREDPEAVMTVTLQEEEEPEAAMAVAPQEEEEAQAKSWDASARVRPAGEKTAQYVEHMDRRGQPLSSKDRTWFGSRMGYDFKGVNVHTGSEAEASARDARAKAYTYGNDIVLAPGQYNTDSHAGRELMAHELTHVVRQGGGKGRGVGAVRGTVGRKVQRGFWGEVWDGIRGGARVAWGGVTAFTSWSTDVMKSAGAWVWNVITWAPARVWRILKHVGSGIAGICSSAWNGLTGWLGQVWDGATSVLRWLGDGVEGVFGWMWRGLQGGGSWVWRLLSGDFSGFWDGLAGGWSWLGDGVRGLFGWGWRGLEGLLRWSLMGIGGFARWLRDGAVGGLAWIGRFLGQVFDLLGAGESWTTLSNLLKFWSTRTLTAGEEAEARKVFGGSVPYSQVRIDEASVIAIIGAWFQGASGMGVTTAATINFNRRIHAAPGNVDMAWLIHELAHVSQYVHVGLQYLGEAIHAQATDGYAYGGAVALAGKDLKDFNREQQADILKHYYLHVEYGRSSATGDYTRMRDQAIRGRF